MWTTTRRTRNQKTGGVLHFLSQQRRAIHLDYPQYATDLMQQFATTFQSAGCSGLFCMRLQRLTGCAKRDANLASDHINRLGGHLAHARRSVPAVEPARRKPDTLSRNCVASSASLPMDWEVAVVPSAVCVEISRRTCMVREMALAAAAC